MMFKFAVRRRVRRVWSGLDRRDRRPALRHFSREFTYTNLGADHAFGGSFRTLADLQGHLDVVFGLVPGLSFDVHEVIVQGTPASTTVVVRVGLSASLPDGVPYSNELVQYIRLRWGKVTELIALVDNVRARQACDRIGQASASRISEQGGGHQSCTSV